METFVYNETFRSQLSEDPHPFGEVRMLESLASPGITAIDVGANKGLTTVAMARKIGHDGHVYAFEPVPEYYRRLRGNLSRNNVKNVETHRLALGDRTGSVNYYKDNGGSGIVLQKEAEQISVEMRLLDAFADEEELGSVDLVSMDCEGSELKVLKGGERTLTAGPITLFFEIHRELLGALGQSLDQILEWLRRRDFRLKPVLIEDMNKDIGYGECTHIIATRKPDTSDPSKKVEKLERELSELKNRWPAHSVSPSMVRKKEELEEKLEEARRENRTM